MCRYHSGEAFSLALKNRLPLSECLLAMNNLFIVRELGIKASSKISDESIKLPFILCPFNNNHQAKLNLILANGLLLGQY